MKNIEVIDALLLRKNSGELDTYTDDEGNIIIILGNANEFYNEIANENEIASNDTDYEYDVYYSNIKTRLQGKNIDTDFIILN